MKKALLGFFGALGSGLGLLGPLALAAPLPDPGVVRGELPMPDPGDFFWPFLPDNGVPEIGVNSSDIMPLDTRRKKMATGKVNNNDKYR